MKFFDILRISLHNIFHNKGRTLITILIVFVVAFLIMVITTLGISFSKSATAGYEELYDKNGALFHLEARYVATDTYHEFHSISGEEYKIVMDEFSAYPEIVDNVRISTERLECLYLFDEEENPSSEKLLNIYEYNSWEKYRNAQLSVGYFSAWGDLDYYSTGISYLKSGSLWNKEDENSSKVWVSEEFIAMALNNGVQLEVGSDIVISFSFYIRIADNQYESVHKSGKFSIGGIFLNSALKSLQLNSHLFIEVMTAANLLEEHVGIRSVSISNEPRIGYNFNEEYNKMNTVLKNVNKKIAPNKQHNRLNDRFRCDIIESIHTMRLIGIVLTGAMVFISFIVLIISIGGVANSIIISVDKNRRFLGVMMAVGLRGKGVKKLVQIEALTIILIATGLAYGLMRLLSEYFSKILDFFMKITGMTSTSILVMPIYIPVVSIIAFVAMALFFAKSSIRRIIHMDVVSVISEVA